MHDSIWLQSASLSYYNMHIRYCLPDEVIRQWAGIKKKDEPPAVCGSVAGMEDLYVSTDEVFWGT